VKYFTDAIAKFREERMERTAARAKEDAEAEVKADASFADMIAKAEEKQLSLVTALSNTLATSMANNNQQLITGMATALETVMAKILGKP